jgi:hypothetical protein
LFHLFVAGTTRAIPFLPKLVNEPGHSPAYPIQAYSTNSTVHTAFDQFEHLQVGEGEQVLIPAGRVHSVATLGPRVCLSLYSTDAFDKGKEDKSKKKVVGKAAAKEMANESTQVYVTLKRKYMKEKKQTKAAADKKKKNERE